MEMEKKIESINPEKVLLVTHTDSDGLGCYLVGRYRGIPDENIIVSSIKDVDDKTIARVNSGYYDHVIIADLPVSAELCEFLNNSDIKWICIDHHPTNPSISDGHVHIVTEMDGVPRSACWSFYRLFQMEYWKWFDSPLLLTPSSEEDVYIDGIIETISNYDTWWWQNKKNANIDTMQHDDFWSVLISFYKIRFMEITDVILAKMQEPGWTITRIKANSGYISGYHVDLIDRTDRNFSVDEQYTMMYDIYQSQTDRAREEIDNGEGTLFQLFNWGEYRCALMLVYGGGFDNLQAHHLYETRDDIDMVVQVYPTSCNISLRSKKVHCGDFAKRFGGGGHPGAAGIRAGHVALELIHLYHKIKNGWEIDMPVSVSMIEQHLLDFANNKEEF